MMSKLILLVLVEKKMALTDPSINLQSIKTQTTFISAGNKFKHIASCPKKHRILVYEKYHHGFPFGLVVPRPESRIGHNLLKCGKDLEVNPSGLCHNFNNYLIQH